MSRSPLPQGRGSVSSQLFSFFESAGTCAGNAPVVQSFSGVPEQSPSLKSLFL